MTATKDGCGGFFNDEPIAYATDTVIIMTTMKEESESAFSQGIIRYNGYKSKVRLSWIGGGVNI